MTVRRTLAVSAVSGFLLGGAAVPVPGGASAAPGGDPGEGTRAAAPASAVRRLSNGAVITTSVRRKAAGTPARSAAGEHALTIEYRDEAGLFGEVTQRWLFNLDTGVEYLDHSALPTGRYLLAMMFRGGAGDLTVVAEPGLVMDRDRTLVFDSSDAKSLAVVLDRPATVGEQAAALVAESPALGLRVALDWAFPRRDIHVLPSSTRAPDVFAFYDHRIMWSPSATASQYTYHIAHEYLGALPADPPNRVRDSELARVETSYSVRQHAGPGRTPATPLFGRRVSLDVFPESVPPVQFPSVRTDFFSCGPSLSWVRQVIDAPDQAGSSVHQTGVARYQPGRRYRERWNAGPFGPVLAPEGQIVPSVGRLGDQISLYLSLASDQSPTHFGNLGRSEGTIRLYRNGRLIGDSGLPTFGEFDVPAAPANYRIDVELRRPDPTLLPGSLTMSWRFRSGHTESATPLPVMAVRYAPRLDEYNAAPAGRRFVVPFKIIGQTRPPRIRDLTVEVSYDTGRTWHNAIVRGNGNHRFLVLHHPHTAGYVALRAHIVDSNGNTTTQTQINAYALATLQP